jgi:hypothetical protein
VCQYPSAFYHNLKSGLPGWDMANKRLSCFLSIVFESI